MNKYPMRSWIKLFENSSPYSDVELERMDIDKLDMLAYGIESDSIVELHPRDIKIKWEMDLPNPEYKFAKDGMEWVKSVSFDEPVEVSINQSGDIELEDGHHRWFAATKLDRPINAKVEIKGNPILRIRELEAKGLPLTPQFPPKK